MSIRRTLATFLLPALLLLVLYAPRAHAQAPGESPLATNVPDREATKVFVLGTPHLSAFADRFEPSMVDSLITLLDAFGPDAIAVEKISGRQAAAMERWGGRWTKVVQRFAGDFLYHGHRVREQTGWSWSEAHQRADPLLGVARSAPAAFGPEPRLSLVRSLTAAYRFPSAVLQWRYLPPDVRAEQTILPDTTAATLDEALTAANEVYSIGVRLAHERGHQRLYPIDHQAEKDRAVPIFQPLMKAIGDSMRKAMDTQPLLRRADSLEEVGLKQGDLLPMYRYLNQEKVGRANIKVQWRTMLDVDLPDDVGRKWLALWENRNLHMAGHIRRVTAQHPGGRVLVIVGSSHKPFFDAYLRQMMGVMVVEASNLLRIDG